MEKLPSSDAKIMLLMARCDYIKLGKFLTHKGRRFLPPSIWRFWNEVLCEVNPTHRRRVLEFLRKARDRARLYPPVALD